MKRHLAVSVLFLGLLCACTTDDAWVRGEKALRTPDAIAVLPARIFQLLPGAVQKDPFLENLTVGHLRLAGGYVVEEELGRQVRSRDISVEGEADYRKQALAWADETVGAALDLNHIRWSRLELPDLQLPLPSRADVRGSTPQDGTDDINLPRFSLRPTPIDPAQLAAAPPGVHAVLAPLVVHYYSHNGGWFFGQRWGCAGGARLRLFYTLYAREDGAVLGWGDLEARALSGYNYSPSSVQIQDLVLAAEGKIRRDLEKSLKP